MKVDDVQPGLELGPSEWREVTQERIDAFAAATDDPQWIHVDPERAAAGPFGTTIAHGYLTLALLVPFAYELLPVEDAALTVNYGLNRVRFPSPVPVREPGPRPVPRRGRGAGHGRDAGDARGDGRARRLGEARLRRRARVPVPHRPRRLRMIRTLLAALAAALALAGPASAAVGHDLPGRLSRDHGRLARRRRCSASAPPGRSTRTPVILLHGNNDTPYPTACNPFYGDVQALADALLARGYAPSELWGLGYQGPQCDILADPTIRSSEAHSTVAERARPARLRPRRARLHRREARRHRRPQPRRDARARVDAAGPRRPPRAAPGHDRQPEPRDHQLLAEPGELLAGPGRRRVHARLGVCREYGAADTPFLHALNRVETPGPTRYLALRNADTSFVYFPVERRRDRRRPGRGPARTAARLLRQRPPRGAARAKRRPPRPGRATTPCSGPAHLGILNSPETWALVADFLTASNGDVGGPR